MSDATFEALEHALAAHIADEFDGALLTHWVIQTSNILKDNADLDHYACLTPSTQALFATMGLLEYAREDLKSACFYKDGEDA